MNEDLLPDAPEAAGDALAFSVEALKRIKVLDARVAQLEKAAADDAASSQGAWEKAAPWLRPGGPAGGPVGG